MSAYKKVRRNYLRYDDDPDDFGNSNIIRPIIDPVQAKIRKNVIDSKLYKKSGLGRIKQFAKIKPKKKTLNLTNLEPGKLDQSVSTPRFGFNASQT